MIKLIASDLDGTLLRGGAQVPSAEAMELIRALQEKGVLFSAASGRQCPNLRRLFWPLSGEMVLLGENGCLVTYKGERLLQKGLDRGLALELIREILGMEGCEALISCPDAYWLLPKTQHYLDVVLHRWKMTVCAVEEPEEICEPILKISMCMTDGLDPAVVEAISARWQGRVANIAVSGKEWLDFTVGNKGEGIRAIRERFGFERDEVVVFGDGYNDIEMLEEAGHSYAMDTAAEAVKAHAGHACSRVEDVLREILDTLQ